MAEERAGGRGQRAPADGLQLGAGVRAAGRAGRAGGGTAGKFSRASLSGPGWGFAPCLLVPDSLGRPPLWGALPIRAESTWSWSPQFLLPPLLLVPKGTPQETPAGSGSRDRRLLALSWDLFPRVTLPSVSSIERKAKPAEGALG